MEMKNPVRMKILVLMLAVFVLGAATAVINYARGVQVMVDNQQMFMVSHTEYRYSEVGQIIVRLVDFQDNPIAVNNCTVSILYPGKSFFVQDALMTATGNITGDHYYNFTTPNGPEGVYEYQATCNYNPNKQKTATNSFHLSSAFNTTIANLGVVMTDLTAINSTVVAFRTEVQANFSQVQAAISSINVTGDVAGIIVTLGQVNTTVNGISANLYSFIVNTTASLGAINTTVVDNLALTTVLNGTVNVILADLLGINTSLSVRFDAVDQAIADGTAAMAANVSDLKSYVSAVNDSIIAAINAISVNLTPVLDAISNVNLTLYNQISAVNLSITSSIFDFRQEVQVNFSQVWDWFNLINATTVSTYDYMTGTLATNINSVLTTIGVINATVNRIEENTVAINSTVNAIKQNQEDEVFISTYSG